jgi:hypothetical protein
VSQDDLIGSVRARLAEYPEASLRGKYLHFAFERLFTYSFAGEDRNRAYVWSSAPYHGLHFTAYALQCPYEQKEQYRLYRSFLQALSPNTLKIGYSNFAGFQMTAVQYNVYRLLRWGVRQFPSLRRWLKKGDYADSPESLSSRLLRDHLASTECPAISREAVSLLLGSPERRSERTLEHILTIVRALCPRPSSSGPR